MFAAAAVINPDGTTGIRLHVDAGAGNDAAGQPFSQNMGAGVLQGSDRIGLPGNPTAHVNLIYFGQAASVAGLNTRSFEDTKDNFFGTTDKRSRLALGLAGRMLAKERNQFRQQPDRQGLFLDLEMDLAVGGPLELDVGLQSDQRSDPDRHGCGVQEPLRWRTLD
jgi:hypothetical protein